jgi:hypothetical protein
MNITTILAIALAISMAGNAGLTWAYLGQRDDTVAAQGERDQARGAAKECSEGTDKLEKLAASRKAEATKARADAAKAAQTHEQAADDMLAAPATGANVCESAQAQVDKWLKGRK